jgi:hypothetical protein
MWCGKKTVQLELLINRVRDICDAMVNHTRFLHCWPWSTTRVGTTWVLRMSLPMVQKHYCPISLLFEQKSNVRSSKLNLLSVVYLLPLAPTWGLAPILEHRADFSVSWSFTEGRTPWTSDSSSQGLYLHTGQHKHRKKHTYIKQSCPEWDSKPRSRPPSERRQ